ncbi:hypothetical protein CKA32_006329 [Geitlerinema sp. FC II]|nr:hypothetical protein CKA32_006329 [Geitlerinema sp. FC II]
MKNIAIASGILTKHEASHCEKLPYKICRLSIQNLDDVVNIRSFASRSIGNLFLDRRPPSQIEQILAQNLSLGLFCQDELVGIRLTAYPSVDTPYLLDALPIPPQEIHRHARLTGVVILPPYRGQNFGSHLTQISLQELKTLGKEVVWATVSPSNYPSLRLFLNLNFRIYRWVKLHENCDRFVLKTDTQMKPLALSPPTFIEHSDFVAQTELLDRGWVGYAIERHALGYRIAYNRELDVPSTIPLLAEEGSVTETVELD